MRSVKEVCLSADGKTVTTRKGDGTIQTWELATGKLLHRWRLDGDTSSRLSPDGKVVAVVGKDNTLVLHAADTGKLLRRFSRPLPANLCSLAFSADGKILIAGHFKPAEFSLWDVATGHLLCWEKSDRDLIVAAALSPGGKVLALGSLEGSLRIWDRGTRKLICQCDSCGNVWGLAFSPDGALLASLSSECCIWLWDTKDYQPVRRLAWRGPQSSFVVYSPGGKLLASNAGRDVVLWEVGTGKVRRTFSGHQGPVTSATFTPDGKLLLTGSRDGSVLVWDLTAPLPPPLAAAPVRRDRYGDPLPTAARARLGCLRHYSQGLFPGSREGFLAFSSDGKRLFVGTQPAEEDVELSGDEARQATLDLHPSDSHPGICVLEVPTGKECLRLEEVPEGIDCLALSPDGKTLAALVGPALYLWEARTGKKKRMAHDCLPVPNVSPRRPRFLTFSPDGRLLAATNEEQIELLDADTGQRIRELRGGPPGVAAMAFSRDGKQLISCSGPARRQIKKNEEVVDPGAVVIWDVGTGKRVRHMALPADRSLGPFCLSADAALLAACHVDQGIRLWDIPGGRELPSIPGAGTAVAFSPDGKLLAIAGPKLRLWDLAANKKVFSLPSPEPFLGEMCFAPDGKLLAARGATRLHFWDIARRQEIVPYEGHRAAVLALACPAASKLLLSGGADRTLRLWDTAASRVVHELHGHEDILSAVALSPDGKQAASLDVDGRVFLWDVATGRRLRQARVAFQPVFGFVTVRGAVGLTFRGDGKTLLVTDATGQLRLWQVSSWQELRSFQGDADAGWPPALSPDGMLLALSGRSAGRRACVRMLEADTGAERWRITDKDDKWQRDGAMFSPDGTFIALSRSELLAGKGVGLVDRCRIILYEAATGKEMLVIDSPSPAAVMAFSPDGKMLAAASRLDRPPLLWDVRTGKLLGEVSGHKSTVTALAFSADGRTLFSAGFDGTILAWDVDRLALRQPERPRDLTQRRLREAWDDLAGADAARAFRAIADLSSVPGKTLPFLQARLRPAVVEDPRGIARLIAGLDSEDFAAREKATQLLTETVDQAEPALRQALRDQPTLETRRRLEHILRHLQTSPEQQRAWRVCLLLDWLDTPEAEKLLRKLAGGAADCRLTREARATTERRVRRQAR
jgi:WD40 repeat protein